jgi:hypothetical protein
LRRIISETIGNLKVWTEGEKDYNIWKNVEINVEEINIGKDQKSEGMNKEWEKESNIRYSNCWIQTK